MYCDNNYIKILSNSIIQATIIFTFLTAFFFSYVSNVEKEEFKKQIEFVVDNIYNRHSNDIYNAFKNNDVISSDNKRYTKTFIYGLIDYEQEEIIRSSKQINSEIEDTNNKIIKDSLFYISSLVIITIIFLIIIATIMRLFFNCNINISEYFIDGLYILLFVFFIELIFLNIVAKNYISADPNYIKNRISEAIIKYIDERNINVNDKTKNNNT